MTGGDKTLLEEVGSSMGRKLRLRRKIKGLSLQQLSEMSGISVSQLSQIERGGSEPSLRSLQMICGALKMPISWLFEGSGHTDTEEGVIVRRHRRRHLAFDELGMAKQLMTPDECPELQMMEIVINPGGGSGPEPISRPGAKCATVLEGCLVLEVEEMSYELQPGDSFSFNSTRPHRYWCGGDGPVRLIWVVTPAMY